MSKGIFTISLDFELHWGVFDKRNRSERMTCYKNTSECIPEMLDMFQHFEVAVTWAVVGALFMNDEADWSNHLPDRIPQYLNDRYSSYVWAKNNGLQEEFYGAHFAPQLLRRIASFTQHEIATHTFSHYYCLEPGQVYADFVADLERVQEISERITGKPCVSLVFPRNQFNDAYLKACFEVGIKVIRSNPSVWYWTGISDESTSLIRRIFRTGDVFLPMGKRTSYNVNTLKTTSGYPLSLPASRLLRQFEPGKQWFNRLRLLRIKNEMTFAARNGECYHLWWHPENFGYNPHECMIELYEILSHYQMLRQRFGMRNWCMRDYAI